MAVHPIQELAHQFAQFLNSGEASQFLCTCKATRGILSDFELDSYITEWTVDSQEHIAFRSLKDLMKRSGYSLHIARSGAQHKVFVLPADLRAEANQHHGDVSWYNRNSATVCRETDIDTIVTKLERWLERRAKKDQGVSMTSSQGSLHSHELLSEQEVGALQQMRVVPVSELGSELDELANPSSQVRSLELGSASVYLILLDLRFLLVDYNWPNRHIEVTRMFSGSGHACSHAAEGAKRRYLPARLLHSIVAR
ncbi:unnamed protein product [Polarella glacialis]|uniref:Uncharacterized protein n=1 Tax=Polarella glacialis TaxID=89957 RepID=A0A813KEA1_POLGL|nr:unnamed protein product [Polarella glacialis]CAE8701275.1 unnamed protein product [Polarella glacialis]